MANPNPQHVPTDGLGVAAYVHCSGSGVTSPSGGTTVHPGASGTNGQGIGATAGGVFPCAQYALTLSVSATGYAATCQLTATAVDVKNNAYTTVNSFVYKSYNDPAAGSPAWYNPKPGTSGGITGNTTYNANVASVSSSGLITALNPGTAIIEVQFPVFDNDIGDQSNTGNPNEMIYSQIIVTVRA